MKALRSYEGLGLLTLAGWPFLDCRRTGHAAGDDCPESLAAYQVTLDQPDALMAHLTRTRQTVAAQLTAAARRGFWALATPTRPSREEPT